MTSDLLTNSFSHADDCIKAACAYANSSKEIASVIIGNEYAFGNFEFIIKFKANQFICKRDLRVILYGIKLENPLYDLIINKYESVEKFVNEHSKLIAYL